MINIEDKTKCVGCSACSDICPKNCIKMKPDLEGFDYPIVDSGLCVNCSACEKVCPILNAKKNSNIPKKVIGCYNKDRNVLKMSSSGGVFFELAKKILSDNGFVYGVEYKKEKKAVYTKVDNLVDLKRITGSKYVQANSSDVFTNVKNDLISGKKVLFSGTPCTIYALKLFLKKDYINLLTVDFVCTGVPSNKTLNYYLLQFEKKYKSNVVDVNFRKKKYGWLFFNLEITLENGKKIHISRENCGFIKALYKFVILRPSCYNCKFRYLDSGSDIKLADFWKSKMSEEKIYNYYGSSHVILSTKKGELFFSSISENFVISKSSYDEILCLNESLCDLNHDISIRSEVMSLIANDIEEEVIKYFIDVTKNDLKTKFLVKVRKLKTVILGRLGR